MQDRFKFRCWDKKEKVMHYDAEETYNGIFGKPKIEHTSFSGLLNDNQYIVMQSTGLKDNNGKLIYEYDVVRFGQEDEDIGIVMWNEDECKFVINEEFNKSLSDFSNWYGEDLEILGNIFEHDFFGEDTTAWLKASNIL